MANIKRILVPVDFSPHADVAVDYARLLANALDASITLAHVCEIPHAMVGIVPGASPQGDLAQEREAASKLMDRMVASLGEADRARIEKVILTGSPTQAIVDRAKTDHYDLIVMGTHGRRGLARVVMGSVAEGVVRGAECPVLTVHLPTGAR